MTESVGKYCTTPPSLRFRFLVAGVEDYVVFHNPDLHEAITMLLAQGRDFSGFLGCETNTGTNWCPISDSLVWQAIAQIALAKLRESEAARSGRRGGDGLVGLGWSVLGEK